MNTTVKKHLVAIHAGKVEKTNIIGIRKVLAHVDRLRAGWSGNRSNATAADADALETALAACRPTVTGELHTTGLAVLRNKKYAKRWTDYQRMTIEGAATFQLLRFDRANYGKGDSVVPVYRVATANGGFSFVFRNIAWQSGGNGPEIEGTDF